MNRPALAVAGAGLLALAAGLGLVLHGAGDRAGGAAPRAAAAPVVERGTVPNTDAAGTSSSRAPATPGAVPAGSRLVIRRLHVDAPVGMVRAPGGVMQVPTDPRKVAWWRDGAAPGDATGSAVVVGHINYAGVAGALSVLPDARPGDAVELVEARATLRYRVAAVRTYSKDGGLPRSAFDRDGAPRLVLITCGGPFDPSTGNYEDNIVVYATPA